MPLTPADVHNVAFAKPPIGKRGYNEDEVDQFLDLVEHELGKLLDEKADLEQRVDELTRELEDARAQRAQEPAAPAPVAAAVAPPPQVADGNREISSAQAARVISLAQEMADRLTSDAQNEADNVLGSARNDSEQMVSQARAESERLTADARMQSEARLRQAQDKADALQADAERKHSEIMATVNQQRSVLEGRLEQLRTFEREYRTRLKTYLESQLEELNQRGSAAPSENAHGGFGDR